MLRVTLAAGAGTQAPVTFVSHTDTASGSAADPVSAETVTTPLAPTFVVATAKIPVPASETFTIPSLLNVVARAMMSGTGAAEALRSSVFRPTMVGAMSV